jgi:hypothetical protein
LLKYRPKNGQGNDKGRAAIAKSLSQRGVARATGAEVRSAV